VRAAATALAVLLGLGPRILRKPISAPSTASRGQRGRDPSRRPVKAVAHACDQSRDLDAPHALELLGKAPEPSRAANDVVVSGNTLSPKFVLSGRGAVTALVGLAFDSKTTRRTFCAGVKRLDEVIRYRY
jgi:hypothetical protein